MQGSRIIGEFKNPPDDPNAKARHERQAGKEIQRTISRRYPLIDEKLGKELFAQLGTNYTVTEPSDNTFLVLSIYLPMFVALFAGLWFMFRKARESIFSGGIMGGFSKSGARRYEAGDKPRHLRRRRRTRKA